MKRIIIISTLFFCFTQLLIAQKEQEEGIFTAAIVAGISLSQIDGDDDASYSKVGMNIGARGGVKFGEKMELCTEILFSQKGATINHQGIIYHLDYIEVPVLFYYKDWKDTDRKNREYMRVMVGLGFSYSRLVNSGTYKNKIWVNADNTPGYEDPFLKNDFMFMVDANFFFFRNWALNFRWSRSLANIAANGLPNVRGANQAFSHNIVIRALYRF